MSVRKSHIKTLRPYLIGERPREDGEWDMHCPLHDDSNRSAQLNVETGVWFCHAGCGGGRVSDLIQRQPIWRDPPSGAARRTKTKAGKGQPKEKVSEARLKGWRRALEAEPGALDAMEQERGLEAATLDRFEVGWDRDRKAYTIPVRGDDGTIMNVRRYQINPPSGRRKIWSVEGMGSPPRLYPVSILEEDGDLIVCEGELDALLTIQHGFPAITRTASADTWRVEWSKAFKGRVVYVCHDMDEKGQSANRKIAKALQRIAEDVRVVELPYPVTKKHGKDLTDFWLEHDEADFRKLLEAAVGVERKAEPEELDPSDVTVLEALDSRRVAQPLRLTVTVKGKREQGYSIPERIHYACTQDAGEKCNICPMNAVGGEDHVDIEPGDPLVLELINASKSQLHDALRDAYGAVRCNRLDIEAESFQGVEILYARPSVEHVNGGAGDYKSIKLTSVGRHDTLPNNTVEVVGALQPDPRTQLNEFQVWEVNRIETSLDTFELDDATAKTLLRFQTKQGERPLKKLGRIAREMSEHVTHIYGRPEMHAAMDLVFHSALTFDFSGRSIQRGWLDLLIVGDTRTGKSEAAAKLSQHYRAGEIVSCEAASFAGIIGGLQQYGTVKEWAINWGVVPLNDRRLVVLDEISGLTTEEIAQMSDVRSRGLAQLTKIQTDATYARTRLIWLGNPRDSRMSDYTYGVQAIRPLIGNAEDIARFDLAMSVRAGEVSSKEINRAHAGGSPRYTTEAASALLRWVWSRSPEQVVWRPGAESAVFKAANAIGHRYTEDPPLVQAANVREKIARIAVAMAGRLFSTDAKHEQIVVKKEHVEDAVAFMDRIYGMKSFGYLEQSKERLKDAGDAERARGRIKEFLYARPGLAKFLRQASHFRRQDLEEIMNIDYRDANEIINHLWEARMVRKVKGDVRIEPALHELLREVNA